MSVDEACKQLSNDAKRQEGGKANDKTKLENIQNINGDEKYTLDNGKLTICRQGIIGEDYITLRIEDEKSSSLVLNTKISLDEFMRALTNLSATKCEFQINENEKIGIVGVNGAGKTTLFKVILKEQSLDSGSVITTNKKRIGYLPQEIVEWISSRVDFGYHLIDVIPEFVYP